MKQNHAGGDVIVLRMRTAQAGTPRVSEARRKIRRILNKNRLMTAAAAAADDNY